jgi:hypothetical protein
MAKGKKTGGRTKGTPNKSTSEIKALAQAHGAEAIKALVAIMQTGESDATKVAAIRELLDRGYGKATQPIAGDPDQPLTYQIVSGVPREVIAQQGEDERETALH